MLRNYIKIALRNIKKHKGYSFINITGLAIGMACCILITIWVLDELSFDKFHNNAPDLYRVEENQFYSGRVFHVTVTPYPMAPILQEETPEIIDATRYVWSGGLLFTYEEKSFFEDDIRAVDPSFLQMFTFPLIKGDSNTALNDPYSLIISKDTAKKYFGEENPIGQVITINNQHEFTVTGVMKNVPHNSLLQFEVLLPYEFLRKTERTTESMGTNSIQTFVQLERGISADIVNEKIRDFIKRHLENSVTELELMPFTQIHLHGYFGYEKDIGPIKYVYVFSVIALFVLLIACINFMNLSTARSANRAREVGMRKVVGAMKRNIIKQFYGESIVYALFALIIAVILVAAFFPAFNSLSEKNMSFNITKIWQIFAGLLFITIFTGLVAGSYPALFLSAFKPVKVLKGSLRSGKGSVFFRRVLVVIQFALSIILIIGTVVVYKQLHFMKTRDIGLDKEHLLYIYMRGDIRNSYDTFKNELLNNPRILGVSGSSQNPLSIGSNSSGAEWDGKDPNLEILIGMGAVDFDFVKTMKIDLIEGRNFSREFETDKTKAFLINEEVVKIMGKESPVGEHFSFMGREGSIIGVMKNFHYQSIRNKIEPIALAVAPEYLNYILIRISPGDTSAALSIIEETWNKVIPSYPFEYRFMDEFFDMMYRMEERAGALLKYFAIFAVLIACLGLFGLASFTAEQRTKEIGIRKVLGASVSQIIYLLSREFFILVVLANLIAWPIAYFVMRNWLQDFAYRASLGIFTFALAMVLALVIAIVSVSFQAIRAAVSNPADSLRYE
jgi:predicted permease